MLTSGRLLQVLVIIVVLAVFYFSHPLSEHETIAKEHEANSDERLSRWVEVVAPHDQQHVLDRVEDPFPYLDEIHKTTHRLPINPFPLGRPTKTSSRAPKVTTHGAEFNEMKFSFQEDLALPLPKVNFQRYKDYAPRNFKPDTKQETFATFLCTRNGSLHDPYFAATLNLVYRNLWSPTVKSASRPFTVFVAPFITQEQRDILAGAGAVIKELALLPWQPNVEGVPSRWRDQFSKIHMWGQTQYDTIAFMDSDAFPITNIDEVFDKVREQTCDTSKLTPEDKHSKDSICQYEFAAASNLDTDGSVNGGFLVLKPELAMRKRLLRNYVKVNQYDNTLAEQSFLGWQFARDSAFPVQLLPRKYNAFFPLESDKGKVSVVHEKLWAWEDDLPSWLHGVWRNGWKEMMLFFESPEFRYQRALDAQIKYEREDRTSDHHAAAHEARPNSGGHGAQNPEKRSGR